MTHIHISTGFAVFSTLFVVGLTGAILWYRNVRKRNQQEFELRKLELENRPFKENGYGPVQPHVYLNSTNQPSPNVVVNQPQPVYNMGYNYGPSYGGYGNNGFVEGLLLGELMSEPHHSTYVEHDTYVRNSSSDSGFSYDSSDYSSSSYSGGFDIDF